MKLSHPTRLVAILAALAAVQIAHAQAPAPAAAAPAAPGQNAAAPAAAARGGGRGGAPRIIGGVGDINRDDPAYAAFDWAPKLDFVKVRTPADEQKAFMLQPGYKIDPVLTDIDGGIKEPTSIAFDGNGRMFVMEDRGYMLTIDAQHQREPNGLISMHEDTKGTGVYDKHTVFIDKLVFPRFMLPYGPNTLLVMETDQDDIWKYTDTNGDGVADKKELFVSGVGQSGNVEHQQGLLMEAMDNWLYMTVKSFRLRQLPNGTVMRETYAVAGREPCMINTDDAKARGIQSGDVVRVFNDRGQILAGAKVTNAIRPGVIRVSEGGWYDPAEPGKPGSLDRYGDVNVLTVDMGTSKLGQGNCGHTAVGNVEKYKGAAPKTSVFTAPGGAA